MECMNRQFVRGQIKIVFIKNDYYKLAYYYEWHDTFFL